MSLSQVATLDVREIAPRDRHPTIFQTFAALKPGEALLLINDHDPKPLYYQFQAESQSTFVWDYLEQGPEVWRVSIGKPAQPHSNGSCCSQCA
jgi:uncharacterized protein (DUF2249 family)